MIKILALAIYLFTTYTFAEVQDLRFGVMIDTASERYCATFQGLNIKAGQDILFASFDPPQWTKGKVIGKMPANCNTTADLPGIGYEVQLNQTKNGNKPVIGVAVVMASAKPAVKSGRPVLYENGNKQTIIFYECASHEGLHFSALQGKRSIWHQYYYLGYDVDPTCSENE